MLRHNKWRLDSGWNDNVNHLRHFGHCPSFAVSLQRRLKMDKYINTTKQRWPFQKKNSNSDQLT